MEKMSNAGSITGARFLFQHSSAMASQITVEFRELNRMWHIPFLNHRLTTLRLANLFVWSLAIAAAGCGEREGKPTDPQAKVSGTVTNNGENVTPDTSVVFFCKDKGATAAGMVDSLGKYNLRPGVGSIGIPAGRYQVMIRAPEPPAPALGTKEYEDFMSGNVKRPEAAKDVPPQFGFFDSSGITLEVKSGENTFDFPLDKLLKNAKDAPAPARATQ